MRPGTHRKRGRKANSMKRSGGGDSLDYPAKGAALSQRKDITTTTTNLLMCAGCVGRATTLNTTLIVDYLFEAA